MHIQRHWEKDAQSDLEERLDKRAREIEGLTYDDVSIQMRPCALLDQGTDRCSSYEQRPVACRTWHSFDVNKCKEDSQDDEDVDVPTNAHTMAVRSIVNLACEMRAEDVQLVWGLYELHSVLRRVLGSNAKLLAQRWLSGEDVFSGCLSAEASVANDGGEATEADFQMREMERQFIRTLIGRPD